MVDVDDVQPPSPSTRRQQFVCQEAAPERIVGTMPVEDNTQVHGLLCSARLTCMVRASVPNRPEGTVG
ncbi:hypothetical protein [Streptomyces sp. NPDC058335]|uniref:hypothetical protein n=1 Tax=Streptomyces sp. NPDC058335 TaxID=3346451 RepID=UPI00364D6E1D